MQAYDLNRIVRLSPVFSMTCSKASKSATLAHWRFLPTPLFKPCKNLIDYAKRNGWYVSAHGSFQFYRAYGAPDDARWATHIRREWRGTCLLGGRTFSEKGDSLTRVDIRHPEFSILERAVEGRVRSDA